MENLFEGGITQLEEIKAALAENTRRSMDLDQAKDALTAKAREIDKEQQAIEDKIQEVLKAKRDATFEPHTAEIEKADEVLKESINQRNAAKEVAVNKRIHLETAGLQEENVQLEYSIRTLFKDSRMPAFCRQPYYYAMYAPKSKMDFLIFVITALIAFVGIPLLVINLVDTTTLGKVFIYVAIVVFFCLIYMAIFFWTQPNRNRKILELARPDMEKIKQNKKEIKRLTKSIRNDKDESSYGLEELDNEIIRNRGIYDDAVARREEALKAFEEQITPAVREEVTGARAEEMNRLQAEKEYLQAEYDRRQQAKTELDRVIQQNYSTYIGKKNMNPEKIDQLINIIGEGKATNILEALDVQKEESKISNRIADAADRIIPDENKNEDLDVEVTRADHTEDGE